MGGLESFPEAAFMLEKVSWESVGMLVTKAQRGIDWAAVEGIEIDYQVDPFVRAGMKIGYLRTEKSYFKAVGEKAGFTFEDTWNSSSEMILGMFGASFILPVDERTRFCTALFLGAGFARVDITRRLRTDTDFGSFLDCAFAGARGTAFVPEFSVEIEHDLTESLAAGAGLGYRFGGVGSFEYLAPADLSLSGLAKYDAGEQVRDGLGGLLTADYGGLFLSFFICAKI